MTFENTLTLIEFHISAIITDKKDEQSVQKRYDQLVQLFKTLRLEKEMEENQAIIDHLENQISRLP